MNVNESIKDLLIAKEAFQWTWDNMGTPHTSDHFNIPANGVEAVNRLIEALSQPGEVNEGVEKAAVETWINARTKAVSEMLDNPYPNGLYRTSDLFQKLDAAARDFAGAQWQSQQSSQPKEDGDRIFPEFDEVPEKFLPKEQTLPDK